MGVVGLAPSTGCKDPMLKLGPIFYWSSVFYRSASSVYLLSTHDRRLSTMTFIGPPSVNPIGFIIIGQLVINIHSSSIVHL